MSSNMRIKRICQHCNLVFIAKTTVTKYCSDACAKANYKKRMKEHKMEESRLSTSQQLSAAASNIATISDSNKPFKELITLSELSAITGLSERTFYRLMKDQKFPRLKVGARLLFRKIDVLNYLTFKYGNL